VIVSDNGPEFTGKAMFFWSQCAAIASDEHNMLAALVGRRGESLPDLLDRLDAAVAKAYDEEIYTDEING